MAAARRSLAVPTGFPFGIIDASVIKSRGNAQKFCGAGPLASLEKNLPNTVYTTQCKYHDTDLCNSEVLQRNLHAQLHVHAPCLKRRLRFEEKCAIPTEGMLATVTKKRGVTEASAASAREHSQSRLVARTNARDKAGKCNVVSFSLCGVPLSVASRAVEGHCFIRTYGQADRPC